jgi:hypothetical protein
MSCCHQQVDICILVLHNGRVTVRVIYFIAVVSERRMDCTMVATSYLQTNLQSDIQIWRWRRSF